jgi:hypothetical protein
MRIRARRMAARPGPIPGRPDAPVTAGRLHGIPSLRARTLLPDPSGRIVDRSRGPATVASPVPIPSLTCLARTGPLRVPPSTRLSRAHSRAVPSRAAGTWAGGRRAAVTPAGPPRSPMTGSAVTPAGPPPSPMTGSAVTPAGPPPSPMSGSGATRARAIGASVTQVPASRARTIGTGVYQTPTAGTCAPRPSGMPAGPARAPVTGTRPGWSRSSRSRSSRSRSSHRSEGHGGADRGEPAQATDSGLRRLGRRGGGASYRAGAGR